MSKKVYSSEVYLPAPSQEVHTHLDCPNCDSGEVVIERDELHQCDTCGDDFEIHLRYKPFGDY